MRGSARRRDVPALPQRTRGRPVGAKDKRPRKRQRYRGGTPEADNGDDGTARDYEFEATLAKCREHIVRLSPAARPGASQPGPGAADRGGWQQHAASALDEAAQLPAWRDGAGPLYGAGTAPKADVGRGGDALDPGGPWCSGRAVLGAPSIAPPGANAGAAASALGAVPAFGPEGGAPSGSRGQHLPAGRARESGTLDGAGDRGLPPPLPLVLSGHAASLTPY